MKSDTPKTNLEAFCSKLSLLSEDDRNNLLNIVKLDKIKAEFEEHKNLFRKLGYHIAVHSPDYSYGSFNKNIMEEEPVLHATLVRNDLGEWHCELSHFVGLVKVTSSQFSFPHKRFTDIFEKQVMAVAKSVVHLQPER